jgi:membrane protease subunit HflK
MFDKLVDLLIQFIRIFQFSLVVKPYQLGVRLRFGKFHATLNPGVHLFFPFWIDSVILENSVTETMRVKPQSLTTKDGRSLVISAVITFHIEDIRTFLLDVEGRNLLVGFRGSATALRVII